MPATLDTSVFEEFIRIAVAERDATRSLGDANSAGDGDTFRQAYLRCRQSLNASGLIEGRIADLTRRVHEAHCGLMEVADNTHDKVQIRMLASAAGPDMYLKVGDVCDWPRQEAERWQASGACEIIAGSRFEEFCRSVADLADELGIETAGNSKAFHSLGGERRKKSAPRRRRTDEQKCQDARNRWLYEQCIKGKIFDAIIAELKRIHSKEKWRLISTPQGIKKAANTWAHMNGKPKIPPRRKGLT